MEEQANQVPVPDAPVYRPQQPQAKPKKSAKPVIVVLIVVSIILILGGLFYFLGSRGEGSEPSPTPGYFENDLGTPEPEQTEEPEDVDFGDYKVDVKNGTGIAQEASYLQGKLEGLGFGDIETGNASSTDNTSTLVTFSKELPDSVVDKVTAELESIYKEVDTKVGDTGSFDIVIVTGLRKGQTPKAEATSTPSSTPTSSPKATASSTPTPTPTQTPN